MFQLQIHVWTCICQTLALRRSVEHRLQADPVHQVLAGRCRRRQAVYRHSCAAPRRTLCTAPLTSERACRQAIISAAPPHSDPTLRPPPKSSGTLRSPMRGSTERGGGSTATAPISGPWAAGAQRRSGRGLQSGGGEATNWA